ncbi:MAG: HMA2 domain-containing protein [Desulfomonilaceae bacterium]
MTATRNRPGDSTPRVKTSRSGGANPEPGRQAEGPTSNSRPGSTRQTQRIRPLPLITPSLLNCSGPLQTVSNLPGRTRFRTSALVGNDFAMNRLTENLPKLDGVNSVEVNTVSGSALVYYQSERIEPELLFTAILKLLDLEAEFLRAREPMLARELRDMIGSMNRAMYEFTHGITDVTTLILIALAILGMYKWGKNPSGAFPGGFPLVWWAYTAINAGK